MRHGKPAAVLLVDVDRFKYVNDTYGHQAGDELLCQVSHRLRPAAAGLQHAGPDGEDEFAAILTDLADATDAELVAKMLVEEFKQPVDLRGRGFYVTVSVGSAIYPARRRRTPPPS